MLKEIATYLKVQSSVAALRDSAKSLELVLGSMHEEAVKAAGTWIYKFAQDIVSPNELRALRGILHRQSGESAEQLVALEGAVVRRFDPFVADWERVAKVACVVTILRDLADAIRFAHPHDGSPRPSTISPSSDVFALAEGRFAGNADAAIQELAAHAVSNIWPDAPWPERDMSVEAARKVLLDRSDSFALRSGAMYTSHGRYAPRRSRGVMLVA